MMTLVTSKVNSSKFFALSQYNLGIHSMNVCGNPLTTFTIDQVGEIRF